MKKLLLYLLEHMVTIVNRVILIAAIVALVLCALWLWSGGFKDTFMPQAPVHI